MPQRVGQNVRLYRDRKGISQRALIEAMAVHGFTWYQQTIRRVESGTQSLKLEEAGALAETLGVPIHLLLRPSAETQATESLYAARMDVIRAHEGLSAAVLALLDAGDAAEHRIGLFTDSASDRVKEACEEVLAAVAEHDVDSAVAEGGRRYEEGEPRD
jgi:transcriptional regulator with XRE-family HTH domain